MKLYQKLDPLDIIGKRFGKLTVRELVDSRNNKYYYHCDCDCGGSIISHRGRLLSGGSTNCGCERVYRPDPSDLIGRKIGKITVIKDLGTRRMANGCTIRYYGVQCECGKYLETTRARLLNGEVQSCGDCTKIIREGDHYRYYCINGESFTFSEQDLELVKQYRWYISNGYPASRSNGGLFIKLTRLLLGLEGEDDVDHIDGNPLNNVRENLRVVSHADNMKNVKLRRTTKTGFKGVSFIRAKGKYHAQIQCDTTHHHLGYFNNPEEAARAYDKAARFYFGEYACLNFPDDGEQGCFRDEKHEQLVCSA